MSKRIITIDYLRGFAIFLMLFVHVFVNSSKIMESDPFGSIGMIIFFIFIFIFGHFRGFFILISGVAIVYTIRTQLERGKTAGQIIKKQVGVGAFLVVFGHLKDTFINQWGILREWYLEGGFKADNFNWSSEWSEMWQLGIISEAIQSIGWCLIFTSIIYTLLASKIEKTNTKKMMIYLLVIIVIILYVSQPLQLAISSALDNDIYNASKPWEVNINGINHLWLYFVYDFFGAESPVFPMLAYSLFGAIIGIYLTQDKLDPSFTKQGYKFGLVLILWGAVDMVIGIFLFGQEFDPLFHVHPSWYVLVACGIMIMLVMKSLKWFEFNKNMTPEKMKKKTLFIRRWGMFSLTVYSLQIFEYIPRAILANIFPQSNLREWTEASLGWVFIFMALNVLMWTLIVWGFEKIKMKGTLEWMMLKFVKRGQINKEDPLNMKGNLYDVEPIIWTNPDVETLETAEN